MLPPTSPQGRDPGNEIEYIHAVLIPVKFTLKEYPFQQINTIAEIGTSYKSEFNRYQYSMDILTQSRSWGLFPGERGR